MCAQRHQPDRNPDSAAEIKRPIDPCLALRSCPKATLSSLPRSTAPRAFRTEDTRMIRLALATLLVSTALPLATALAQTEAEPEVTPAAPVEAAPTLRPTVAPSDPPITAPDP